MYKLQVAAVVRAPIAAIRSMGSRLRHRQPQSATGHTACAANLRHTRQARGRCDGPVRRCLTSSYICNVWYAYHAFKWLAWPPWRQVWHHVNHCAKLSARGNAHYMCFRPRTGEQRRPDVLTTAASGRTASIVRGTGAVRSHRPVGRDRDGQHALAHRAPRQRLAA